MVSFFNKIASIISLNIINFLINSSYTAILTISFSTTLLSSLKSIGVVSNLPISYLSTSDFELAESTFLATCTDVSVPVALKFRFC